MTSDTIRSELGLFYMSDWIIPGTARGTSLKMSITAASAQALTRKHKLILFNSVVRHQLISFSRLAAESHLLMWLVSGVNSGINAEIRCGSLLKAHIKK